MALGPVYIRHCLVKLAILSAAIPFILRDYFTGQDTDSEPAVIYLLLAVWVLCSTFFLWHSLHARRRAQAGLSRNSQS